MKRPIVPWLVLLLAPGCRALGLGGPDHRVVESASGEERTLEAMAAELAGTDVVFLGELHDSEVTHELQFELTRLLHQQRPVVVSLEMFERDVQAVLDDYLAGAVDEETFLDSSRPWTNYDPAYRRVVEWARAQGVPVVAANAPRELARRVTDEGLAAVLAEPFAPERVAVDEPAYRARFEEAMADHDGVEAERMDAWFAAQCLKDDAMAESIAAALAAAPERRVVHWNGRFHSDHRLGTVSRLLARDPALEVAVVTSSRTDDPRRAPTDEERAAGDWIWLVGD